MFFFGIYDRTFTVEDIRKSELYTEERLTDKNYPSFHGTEFAKLNRYDNNMTLSSDSVWRH